MLGIVYCILTILIIVLVGAVFGVWEKTRLTKEKLITAQAEYDKLAVRYLALEEDLARLETQQGIEEEIRERYRAVKAGERLAVVVEEDTSDTIGANRAIPRPSLWKRVSGFFSGFFE